MLPKPLYKALVKRIQTDVTEQEVTGLVAITMDMYANTVLNVSGRTVRVDKTQLRDAWPNLMKQLHLVDDDTNSDTFTLPGFGYIGSMAEYDEEVVNKEQT